LKTAGSEKNFPNWKPRAAKAVRAPRAGGAQNFTRKSALFFLSRGSGFSA